MYSSVVVKTTLDKKEYQDIVCHALQRKDDDQCAAAVYRADRAIQKSAVYQLFFRLWNRG